MTEQGGGWIGERDGGHSRTGCGTCATIVHYKCTTDKPGLGRERGGAPGRGGRPDGMLVRRFARVEANLQTETEQFVSGFQSGPSRYRFEHMPRGFEVVDFIASWNQYT